MAQLISETSRKGGRTKEEKGCSSLPRRDLFEDVHGYQNLRMLKSFTKNNTIQNMHVTYAQPSA